MKLIKQAGFSFDQQILSEILNEILTGNSYLAQTSRPKSHPTAEWALAQAKVKGILLWFSSIQTQKDQTQNVVAKMEKEAKTEKAEQGSNASKLF